MDLSVIIPTYRRPEKLASCLRSLAAHSIDPDRFEVLVGLDGPDPQSHAAAESAWSSSQARLVVKTCDRLGLNAVRNALLSDARGRFLVSLNDDVTPCRTFLETHLREQLAAESRGLPAVVSGYSPWKMPADPTLFDRLVAESSMIFFFDTMTPDKVQAVGPMHDWGFRHCYGLNFSAPTAMIRETGGFVAFPLAYGYDDIEIAYRLHERFGTPVLYRPEAVAEHDHRYGPVEVLTREFKLGHCAWHFAGRDPAFCRAVFRRDVRSAAELAYSREYLAREEPTAAMVKDTFLRLAELPASAAGDRPVAASPLDPAGASTKVADASRDMIRMIYLHHLPLKRWMWRAGLVAAAEELGNDAVRWPK
jgi:GT2 family glycosyltransferase